jgi:putative transposase
MPAKRREVRLTAAERDVLERFVAHGKKSARAINRARLLLLLDEARPAKELTKILGGSRGTIYHVRKKYMQKAHEHILDLLQEAPRSGRPIKIDRRVEANVTLIACSEPPEGYGRWTRHMIADKLVPLEVIDAISHESVRRTLKKTD